MANTIADTVLPEAARKPSSAAPNEGLTAAASKVKPAVQPSAAGPARRHNADSMLTVRKLSAPKVAARATPSSAASDHGRLPAFAPGLGRTASAVNGLVLAALLGVGAIMGGNLMSEGTTEKLASRLTQASDVAAPAPVTSGHGAALIASTATLRPADDRSPAVFSASQPLFAVPMPVPVPRPAVASTSTVVRTVDTVGAARPEAIVAPARRQKPAAAEVAQHVAKADTSVPTGAATANPSSRAALAVQPYGLGAGNIARSANVAPKSTSAKKIVCKTGEVLNSKKTACVAARKKSRAPAT